MSITIVRRPALSALAVLSLATAAGAQSPVTTPTQFFGHEIGADYQLPNYTQFAGYWRKLDAESDRMEVREIGKTAEGRTQLMAIITSPENHRNLERYRQISERLAKAEGLTDAEAQQLAREGKAIVWIDGGLHATEVLGAQGLAETVYQLVSRSDPETLRILDDVVILAVQNNPDGMELVSDWYMRKSDPKARNSGDIPRLYQKYIGHDNNRDFYMSTQPETENMNRQMFHVWFPQIMYNHHQTGPSGTVMFSPPFRDPFNYVFDPLIVSELDLVGAAMHTRFLEEGKPGVTTRSGANYSTWWNGGLRTTMYFHNMVGLLTEAIGNPTPIEIPFIPNRQLPHGDLPAPIEPQVWHFRQAVEYEVTANYAVLDVASRYKDTFLYNIYQMGRNSIQRGSTDTWTVYPKRIDKVRTAMEQKRAGSTNNVAVMSSGGLMGATPDLQESQAYLAMIRTPETRDPRAYILPADQPDFPTVVEFVNTMLENGLTVHRATADFTVNGKRYPKGSIVVKTAQAFRPQVLDTFEPQDHPNDFLYPGGPPIPPYDATGWTLAYQMGVDFDRILEGFDAPLEVVDAWNIQPPAGTVAAGPAAGWLLSPKYVDAYPAALKLVRQGERVYRLGAGAAGAEPGSFYVASGNGTRAKLEAIARETGMSFTAAAQRPAGEAMRLSAPRIALWDQYGGSSPSGWTRWLMEQEGMAFDVVYPQQLDAGNLRKKYDVIVFVDGAIPAPGERLRDRQPEASEIPADLRGHLGTVTEEKTIPQLRSFLEQGGTVVTIGSSTALAQHLGVPVTDALVDASGKPLARTTFFIPGSIVQARVDTSQPLAYGMDERTDFFFDHSPAFKLQPGAEAKGVKQVAWYDSAEPLRSGWAWGQEHLQGGAAVVQAPVGQGTLYLFGPEILYRAQPHGTFKLFFNSLAQSASKQERVR